MALETVTHIDDLVVTNPASGDPASQGDDHIRNIKKALKATFPNITEAVTLTADEINSIPDAASELDQSKADKTITISAGDGLSGGGTLGANRTLTVNATVVRTSRSITAGTGLSGGGDLSADRSLSVNYGTVAGTAAQGNDARILNAVPNVRTLTAGDGLSGGGSLTGDRSFSVDATVVRTSRTLTAGDGLSGGGSLAANRSFSVDSSVVRTSRSVSAGNGMTGGGTLSGNVTISMGLPASIGDTTSNAVSSTSHTHEIGPTIARSATRVNAGSGLTGGGTLAADRTLTLGTPSSITDSSTNEVTGSSHTHSISALSIRRLLAQADVGIIGTYAMCMPSPLRRINPGVNVSGSALKYASGNTGNESGPTGTWQCFGYADGSKHDNSATLFLRVA